VLLSISGTTESGCPGDRVDRGADTLCELCVLYMIGAYFIGYMGAYLLGGCLFYWLGGCLLVSNSLWFLINRASDRS